MHLARTLCLVVAVLVGATACETPFSDPLGHRRRFEEIQQKFTKFIRWGAIDEASIFVIDEQRDAFLGLAPELNDIRFTDYEILRLDYNGRDENAHAEIRYTGYRLSMPIEQSFRVEQDWNWDDDDGGWTVSLNVEELALALSTAPAKQAPR